MGTVDVRRSPRFVVGCCDDLRPPAQLLLAADPRGSIGAVRGRGDEAAKPMVEAINEARRGVRNLYAPAEPRRLRQAAPAAGKRSTIG